jgi:uncharacterized protein YdaU (DUF1376 family)
MVEENNQVNTGGRGLTNYFKRAIGYTYPQVVSECASLPTTQMNLEKVTNMVGTFLNKGGDSFQKIRVPPTKTEPEKVDATVTTFLNEDRDGWQKIRVETTKADGKRLPIWREPFVRGQRWSLDNQSKQIFNEILKQFQPMNLSKKNHYQQNKEYSEYSYFSILFVPISTKAFF